MTDFAKALKHHAALGGALKSKNTKIAQHHIGHILKSLSSGAVTPTALPKGGFSPALGKTAGPPIDKSVLGGALSSPSGVSAGTSADQFPAAPKTLRSRLSSITKPKVAGV